MIILNSPHNPTGGMLSEKDIDATAGQWIRTGTVTEPDARHAAGCGRRIERYASLLEAINGWAAAHAPSA